MNQTVHVGLYEPLLDFWVRLSPICLPLSKAKTRKDHRHLLLLGSIETLLQLGCYMFLLQVWVQYLIKLNQRTNGLLNEN